MPIDRAAIGHTPPIQPGTSPLSSPVHRNATPGPSTAISSFSTGLAPVTGPGEAASTDDDSDSSASLIMDRTEELIKKRVLQLHLELLAADIERQEGLHNEAIAALNQRREEAATELRRLRDRRTALSHTLQVVESRFNLTEEKLSKSLDSDDSGDSDAEAGGS